MIRAALLAVAALLFAPLAAAQAPKAVAGDWITLGDVTPVTGEHAGILIGPAPPLGQTLALDPGFLVSVAKKAGVILAIPLDQPIYVVRGTGNAPAAKPANTARVANPAPQIGGRGEPAQVLVLLRDIARGEVIGQDDVEWADATSAQAARSGQADMGAIGKEAKRALKAGQPVLNNDLKAATVIRKGEAVKIIYVAKGLRLSVDGVAQADAAKGEPVRILNSYSKRSIDAVAEASGEARVNSR